MTEMAMRRATRPFATALVAASLLLGPAGSARASLRCPVFPPDNPWNQRVDTLPVHPRSAAYVASLGADLHLHADFGSSARYGIPYIVVRAPAQRCRSASPPTATRATPARTRSRRARRSRAAAATATCSSSTRRLQALRAVRAPGRARHRLGRRLGRGLRPALERAAPRRLDLGRRRRPADLPRPRPLRRGRGRRHPTTRSASPSRAPSAAYIHPARHCASRQHRPDRCRRWACACASRRATTLGRLPRPGARDRSTRSSATA